MAAFVPLIGRKVSRASIVAELCQAWAESNLVEVHRVVAGVDSTRCARLGQWVCGGCDASKTELMLENALLRQRLSWRDRITVVLLCSSF